MLHGPVPKDANAMASNVGPDQAAPFEVFIMSHLIKIYCTLIANSAIFVSGTVKILKFGTPQTIAIIVLKIDKFDVTLH